MRSDQESAFRGDRDRAQFLVNGGRFEIFQEFTGEADHNGASGGCQLLPWQRRSSFAGLQI